jgi:hypothetical protein
MLATIARIVPLSLTRAAARFDQSVHEDELDDDRRRQRERIKIRQAHAAIDRVDREGERLSAALAFEELYRPATGL